MKERLKRIANLISAKYQTGVVKWYREDGVGYIIPDDSEESIMFGKSALQPKNIEKELWKAKPNSFKVKFLTKEIMGKEVATDVRKR